MAYFQAFLVMTLLTWAAVSLSGTTEELSKTTGDTVNIPCPFVEGTVRNIYWYYTNCTGGHKIVFFVKEEFTFGAEYANRTNLQKDNSTLILTDITVADEGTYCCTVDRQGQTAVSDINTKLNVFSLPPDTLPVISPCTGADESSSCSIHANQSFTLTCTLLNVYPVQDAELIWYQDGKRVSFTDDVTQNDDGTTDISEQIQVSETGSFTCNATYLSANGKEDTAASVEAWIILPVDAPNTPGTNLTSGEIVGITTGTVVLVGILAIIAHFIYRRKSRGDGNPPNPQNRIGDSQQYQVTTEVSELLDISPETGSKNRNAGDGDPPTPQNSNDGSQQDQATGPSAASGTSRSNRREVTNKQINKLSKLLPYGKYSELCGILGFDFNYIEKIKNSKLNDVTAAFEVLLQEWKMKGRTIENLDTALRNADLGGLVPEYKN